MKRLLIFVSIALCACGAPKEPLVGEVVFGTAASDAVPSAASRLNYPEDAVEGPDGSIYISDTHLHVIRRMKDGIVEVFAGTFNPGYNGDGHRTSVQLHTPTALLISQDQSELIVADSGNGIIRKINLAKGTVSNVAGLPGYTTLALPKNGDVALGSPIGYAAALKYDDNGRICYSSSQMTTGRTAVDGGVFCISKEGRIEPIELQLPFKAHGIRDFLMTGEYTYFLRDSNLYQLSRSGALKALELHTQHGKGLIQQGNDVIVSKHTSIYQVHSDLTYTSLSSNYANVSNIKKSSKGLLVVDSDQGVIFSIENNEKKQLIGTSGDSVGALTGITRFGQGQLLILDNQRPRIFLYDIASGKSSLWAGTGNQQMASINVDKLDTGFYYPSSLAADSNGNVYVAEPNRIMKIDPHGQVSRYAGHDTAGDVDSDNPENARFRSIGAISLNADGDLFIADTYNNKVKKISTKGNVTTVAGTGTAGIPRPGTPATATNINHPLGVLARKGGDLLIADAWNNNIIRIDSDGVVHEFAGTPAYSTYQGLGSFSGDNQDATGATLNTPAYLTADAAGNIYISDHFNHKIRKVSRSGVISTIAGDSQGYAPLGKRLNFPNGLQVIDGYLYVADSGNRLIVRYKVD